MPLSVPLSSPSHCHPCASPPSAAIFSFFFSFCIRFTFLLFSIFFLFVLSDHVALRRFPAQSHANLLFTLCNFCEYLVDVYGDGVRARFIIFSFLPWPRNLSRLPLEARLKRKMSDGQTKFIYCNLPLACEYTQRFISFFFVWFPKFH